MKTISKHLLTSLLLAAAGTLALPVSADQHDSGLELNPYIGIGTGILAADFNDDGSYEDAVADRFNSFYLNAGLRLHKYFGVEFGVFRSLKEDKRYRSEPRSGTVITGTSKTQYDGYYADLVGYLPLSYFTEEESNLEFIGAIGFGRVSVDWSSNTDAGLLAFGSDGKDDDTGVRYSIGGKYHISDRFSAKALFRYISIDFDDTVNDAQLLDIGIDYKF